MGASEQYGNADMQPMDQLLEIMRRLRDPDGGCPWDRAQSYATIVPFTLEEAYEVADAIERGDFDELRDELGDLLFQVVFYCQIAAEEGRFQFADVARSISDKLLRRHPHVFGESGFDSVAEQTRDWETHKARERASKGKGSGVLDGVSVALPALVRAQKLQRSAARVGFDWEDIQPVLAKVEEEIAECHAAINAHEERHRLSEEIGDLLFACVNLARHLDTDAESALRAANTKFEQRFRHVEMRLAEAERTPHEASLEEMDALWEEAKRLFSRESTRVDATEKQDKDGR